MYLNFNEILFGIFNLALILCGIIFIGIVIYALILGIKALQIYIAKNEQPEIPAIDNAISIERQNIES